MAVSEECTDVHIDDSGGDLTGPLCGGVLFGGIQCGGDHSIGYLGV